MLNIFYFEISITFSYIICLDLLDLLINLCAYLLTHYVIYLFSLMSPGTGLVNILVKHYYVVIINIFQVSYYLAYLDTLFANGTCFIQHSNTYKQSCCSFINSGNIKQNYVKHATSIKQKHC